MATITSTGGLTAHQILHEVCLPAIHNEELKTLFQEEYLRSVPGYNQHSLDMFNIFGVASLESIFKNSYLAAGVTEKMLAILLLRDPFMIKLMKEDPVNAEKIFTSPDGKLWSLIKSKYLQ